MTDDKYQEMMQRLHQAGKITSGAGDMPALDSELMRRIEAAKESGLVKGVPYLEIKDPRRTSWKAMGQEQFAGPFKEYAESSAQADKNTRELMALGVPYEKLQPFVMKRNEEESQVHNLNRRNQPDPLGQGLISYSEDRSLGLDPSKYTQKPWNSGDYIGYSEGNPIVMSKISQEMKERNAVKDEQQRLLGPEPKELSAEEMAAQKKKQLMALMGVDEKQFKIIEEQARKDREYFASEGARELIQRLNLDVKDGEVILNDDDEKLLDDSFKMQKDKMTPRQILIQKLMTGGGW